MCKVVSNLSVAIFSVVSLVTIKHVNQSVSLSGCAVRTVDLRQPPDDESHGGSSLEVPPPPPMHSSLLAKANPAYMLVCSSLVRRNLTTSSP